MRAVNGAFQKGNVLKFARFEITNVPKCKFNVFNNRESRKVWP